MTRINIVPPEELYDQHLVAEYREIFMVPGSLKRTLASKTGFRPEKVPNQFTLNAGHVYFFYDKGRYLAKRYSSLIHEMKRRGMQPDPTRKFPVDAFPDKLFNDWSPTAADLQVVRDRIAKRVAAKPHWYRKTDPLD